MTISIDAGDPSQRLRLGLGLTGRIPLALDETCVPVAVVGQFAQPPYAVEPRQVFATASGTGDATNAGLVVLENPTSAGHAIIMVIDWLDFGDQNVAAPAVRIVQLAVARNTDHTAYPGLATDANLIVGTEQGTTQNGLVPTGALWTGKTGGLIGRQIYNATINPASFVETKLFAGLCLFPNDILAIADGQLQAKTLNVNFAWKEYNVVRP